MGCNSRVNPLSQTREIGVESAENDATMLLGSVQVESKEMTAIVRQQNTLSRGGKQQDFGVRHGGVCISCLKRRQHVVAEAAELRHNLKCDILV